MRDALSRASSRVVTFQHTSDARARRVERVATPRMSRDACVVMGDRAHACARAVSTRLGDATARIMRDDAAANNRSWMLETKYYVVDVRAVTVENAVTVDSEDAVRGARAVIAACGSVEGWRRARDALSADGALGEANAGADARVLVWDEIGVDESGGVPEDAREWALDEGYEVVIARLEDAEADAALRDGEDGDARGVERCVQALEATAWEHMRLKKLGKESDLGRNMTVGGRDPAADVQALAVASGLLGDDANSPLPTKELHAKIAALYDEQLVLKGEERLERLAELLGDAVLDDDEDM